jgi:hypothetical protein
MSLIPHKPKVFITVPNGSGWMHKHVTSAVIRCLSDDRFYSTAMFPTWVPYEHNLNRCAQQMLDDGYDYWLSMDDDNPPTNNPLDLVPMDLDFVGFPTPVWHSAVKGDRPYYFNALVWCEEEEGWKPYEENTNGLQEVHAVGTGCFLVARRVIAATKFPFARKYDEDGIVTHGHDYLFCKRIRESGFKVWTHFGYICQHFNELELLETIESFASIKS